MVATKPRIANPRAAAWAVRLAFALVFVINVQCAVQFVMMPEAFMGSYQLEGVPGIAAVQGIGVAFLMWNCTYPAVIVSPRRFRSLAVVVIIQQIVGLVGETYILASLPSGFTLLSLSILRFIVFDGAGLVLMTAAFIWFYVVSRAARKAAAAAAGDPSTPATPSEPSAPAISNGLDIE